MGVSSSGMEENMTGIKIQKQKLLNQYQDIEKSMSVLPNT